jgi:hypothetical protein
MNIFFALNNLKDITMDKNYSLLLGLTEQEIINNFDGYLDLFSKELNIDKSEVIEKLRAYYNGYRFSKNKEKVYNPFSILNCFDDREFKNYWSQTGVPYYLANMLKERNYYLPDLDEGIELSEDELTSFELDNLDPVVVLFQAGFLTIKDYKIIKEKYILGFPNKEVKSTFNSLMLSKVYGLKKVNNHASDVFEAFYYGEVAKGLEIFKTIFSSIPYTLLKDIKDYESFYHNLFYMMVSVAGLYATSELLTSKWRIDCVITTDKYVYIIEFKCNQSPDVAIKQIKEKGYADRFKNDKRKIYLIGINFDTEKKEIEYIKEMKTWQ